MLLNIDEGLKSAKTQCYDQIKIDMDEFRRRLSSKQKAATPTRKFATYLISIGVVFTSFVTAGAAVKPLIWHKILVYFSHGSQQIQRIRYNEPDERLWMEQSERVALKSYPIKNANEFFPYTVSRPKNPALPLVRTLALQVSGNYVVWDRYQSGREWVVVDQKPNFILEGHGTVSAMSLIGEPIVLGKGVLATIEQRAKGVTMLNVFYLNQNRQGIQLTIDGNVGQATLEKIAKSYLPSR